MKTSDFKKGRKVKMISWKKALKLYKYQDYNTCITVPYGDDSGHLAWDKSDYKHCANNILIMKRVDEDGDIEMTIGRFIQPALLMPITSSINFKSILSNN